MRKKIKTTENTELMKPILDEDKFDNDDGNEDRKANSSLSITSLPAAVLFDIFRRLSPQDLLHVSHVSRLFQQLASEDFLWRNKLAPQFKDSIHNAKYAFFTQPETRRSDLLTVDGIGKRYVETKMQLPQSLCNLFRQTLNAQWWRDSAVAFLENDEENQQLFVQLYISSLTHGFFQLAFVLFGSVLQTICATNYLDDEDGDHMLVELFEEMILPHRIDELAELSDLEREENRLCHSCYVEFLYDELLRAWDNREKDKTSLDYLERLRDYFFPTVLMYQKLETFEDEDNLGSCTTFLAMLLKIVSNIHSDSPSANLRDFMLELLQKLRSTFISIEEKTGDRLLEDMYEQIREAQETNPANFNLVNNVVFLLQTTDLQQLMEWGDWFINSIGAPSLANLAGVVAGR